MSSDGYFEDDLDSAFLEQVDAIEAAHVGSQRPPSAASSSTLVSAPKLKQPPPKYKEVIEIDDDDDDAFEDSYAAFDIDEEQLKHFDEVCNVQTSTPVPKKPVSRWNSKGTVQTTLFGDIAVQNAPTSKGNGSSAQRTASSSRIPIGRPKRTKQWDRTAFAKTGWKKPKGKAKTSFGEDEEEEEWEEPVEFEQFPAPEVDIGYPPPMKLKPDLLSVRRWIYPLNQTRRDYQFNIVKKCLFENTLVALPTGLGKTFIAGVVMLNFYTWFPEGKVVFVAPTKPLVAQQIEACHRTCGIPGSHAAELTGQNPRAHRAKAWREKRVFYMTPQTLMNDLKTDNCDPQDIVLLVIDEAHKGTGDYAYAQVIRYLMAKNPHFRVLALTATPGSTPEAVQDLVDALHISHIEIRDENSLDLRAYMHKKHLQQYIVPVEGELGEIRDMLADLMMPIIKQLDRISVFQGHVDPVILHPYRCQAARTQLQGRRDKQPWAFKPLLTLGTLARAMGYLLEASLGMCYTYLKDLAKQEEGDKDANGKKKGGAKIAQDPKFKAILAKLEDQQNRGLTIHPKMERMKTLLVQHFGKSMLEKEEAEERGDAEAAKEAESTRVMVFVSFRECVDEVVELLNQENPMIRAVKFIGQGTDKRGQKGYAQKEQLEVLKKFKSGEYNVLVSTSIGEEGLDIGEVDMIVCYDAQKTPIRMLQRVGRTGRKRDGYVHVLLSEGREERNWDKAKEKYETVQDFIVRADQVELFDDVSRMIPEHIDPECVEMHMDIEEYVREEPKTKNLLSPSSKAAAKRKRNDDVMRNVPAGATNGFVSVKDLLTKGASSKKRKKPLEFDPDAYEEDSDDRDIEAGIFAPRRAVSLSTDSKPAKKPRRTKTIAGDSTTGKTSKAKRTTKKKNPSPIKELTASQVERLAEDDSDDLDIQAGLLASPKPAKKKAPAKRKAKAKPLADDPPRTPPRKKKILPESSSPDVPLERSIIDLTTSSMPRKQSNPLFLPSSPDQPLSLEIQASSSYHSQPDDGLVGSPVHSPLGSPIPLSPIDHDASILPDSSMAWLIEDDSEPEIQVGSSPHRPRGSSTGAIVNGQNEHDSDIEFVDNVKPSATRTKSPLLDSSPIVIRTSSPLRNNKRDDMPPPAALPARFSISSPAGPEDSPIPLTFAVRAPGRQTKKKVIPVNIDSSPLATAPPRKRLQKQRDEPLAHSDSDSDPQPKPKRKKRKFQDTMEMQKHNPWVEYEASHSGEERSAGGSDDEVIANSSDREFVQELPETQISASYDQSAIYRQSLLSQAPASRIPMFARGPMRRGAHQYNFAGPSRRRHLPSSSPDRRDDEPDEYVQGSFVVDDDVELSYLSD
ncbi:hypothetical protein QCA50_001629 [Cerrena zonata]|uniref:ATP-dependent DNA helicase n=1 Tax=Cerrena zonata TaxID=2478898 RepID=A0AAW0GVC6_9APHY